MNGVSVGPSELQAKDAPAIDPYIPPPPKKAITAHKRRRHYPQFDPIVAIVAFR
jgi:hypothetical protein